MKKITRGFFIIIFVFMLFSAIVATIYESTKSFYKIPPEIAKQVANKTAHGIFPSSNVYLSAIDFYKIKDLIERILMASEFEQIFICKKTLEQLDKKIEILNKKIGDDEKKNIPIKRSTKYLQFLLSSEQKHLEGFLKKSMQHRTHLKQLVDYMIYYTGYICSKFHSFFVKKSVPTHSANESASLLMGYIDILNTKIFNSNSKSLSFFVNQQSESLPSIMKFFTNPDEQHTIKVQSEILSSNKKGEVETQCIEALVAMAILAAGSNLSDEWISEGDQKKMQALQKKQQKDSTAFQVFAKKIQAHEKNLQEDLSASFKKAIKKIQAKQKTILSNRSKEQVYLLESINRSRSKKLYLGERTNNPKIYWPKDDDQVYYSAVMFTPESDYTWYNWHKYGDWEYVHERNSFFQNQILKYHSTKTPWHNCIFVSNFIPSKPYEIEVEVRLINVSYPFYAGITFNMARFIPGDSERYSQYRTLGLFGTQEHEKLPDSRIINLQFAQQEINFSAEGKEDIISPLEQIEKRYAQGTYYSMPKEDIKKLETSPQTYIFNIVPTDNKVKFTFSKKGSKTPLAKKTMPIEPMQSVMYNDIGFICPGCQAEFKLTSPKELTFRKDSIEEYKKLEKERIKRHNK